MDKRLLFDVGLVAFRAIVFVCDETSLVFCRDLSSGPRAEITFAALSCLYSSEISGIIIGLAL